MRKDDDDYRWLRAIWDACHEEDEFVQDTIDLEEWTIALGEWFEYTIELAEIYQEISTRMGVEIPMLEKSTFPISKLVDIITPSSPFPKDEEDEPKHTPRCPNIDKWLESNMKTKHEDAFDEIERLLHGINLDEFDSLVDIPKDNLPSYPMELHEEELAITMTNNSSKEEDAQKSRFFKRSKKQKIIFSTYPPSTYLPTREKEIKAKRWWKKKKWRVK